MLTSPEVYFCKSSERPPLGLGLATVTLTTTRDRSQTHFAIIHRHFIHANFIYLTGQLTLTLTFAP